ncbi:hypothetical protein [Miltoncostaea marina]|uniref:hypothetical protein n=1 Tax=Miltoncostaea marina TaxID=2843215 RepID=UPI001C3DAD69|nr:hypothetical protein [Miltoncostaea marina]
MSPEPYVRGQAFAFMAILVAAAVLGPPWAALTVAAVASLIALGLGVKYRSDVRAASAERPAHRERPDLIVAGDARTAFGIALATSGALVATGFEEPDIGLAPATPALVAVAAAGVYVSSLFDWYVILPRVSGLLGRRPCRDETAADRYPSTWRGTTRWWYIHRTVAALLLRFGLSYAAVFSLRQVLDFPFAAGLVAGAFLGFLAPYLRAAPLAARQAAHPSVVVGQTADMYRTEARVNVPVGRWSFGIPGLGRRPLEEILVRAYVIDVSVEGIHVAGAAEREGPAPRGGNHGFQRHARTVALRDAPGSSPSARPFTGCEVECSGINWYCIENPECFKEK